jgi:hypothetical protein
MDRKFNLLLGERVTKAMQVQQLKVQFLPIEVESVGGSFVQDQRKVTANHRFFGNMVGDPTIIMLQPMNMILASSGINSHMKEFCVGIPLFYIGNMCTLLFPSSFHHGEGDHFPFETRPKMHLIDAKDTMLLCHFQMENNKQGGMEQHLGVGEDLTTPRRQALARDSQFEKKDLARIHLGGRFIPRIGDDIFKARHPKPKVFKLESAGLPGPPIIGKQEGAMVR